MREGKETGIAGANHCSLGSFCPVAESGAEAEPCPGTRGEGVSDSIVS